MRGALVAVAAFLAMTAPASAANTFDGSCRLSGTLTFDPPLGNALQPTAIGDAATGTCTGTIDGMPVQDAPVTNRASGSGTLSCLAGQATTHDTLGFGHGIRVRFVTDTFGGLTQFASHFAGDRSGDGIVEVSVLGSTDQSTLEACQAGRLRAARYELVARTITPVTG